MSATNAKSSHRFDWAVVAVATAAFGWLLDKAGLPASYLFVAMLVGLGYALTAPGRVALAPRAFRVGQAVTGTAIGTFMRSSTLSGVGTHWLPVAVVSAATLAVTLAAGLLLSRIARVDPATASLGMVAGGASGIVAMADELGADDRLVAFMQYLRVLVITLLTPLLVPLLFGVHGHGAAGGSGPVLGTATGWALTVGASAAGVLIATPLRIPAPTLLGPLLLTAALTLAGATGHVQVPPLAREAAFALIGLQIGLGFERDTVRRIGRLVAPALALIGALLLACFALAWLLKLTAHESLLNAYLATTPGGLPAVLPLAYGSGADTTFVLAVQGLRLFAMVLAAPALVRWLLGSAGRGRTITRP